VAQRARANWLVRKSPKVNHFGLLAKYIFSLHEDIASTLFLGPPQWHRNNPIILEFGKIGNFKIGIAVLVLIPCPDHMTVF
jgi:hypothetical protein